MASVSMAMSLTHKGQNQATSGAFLKQLPLIRPSNKPVFVSSRSRATRAVQVQASLKEKAITGLTAAALTASMVLPDVAEAADSFSPSLKNFLLSISAGGVVLAAILGAVIGVANFDPVKRT